MGVYRHFWTYPKSPQAAIDAANAALLNYTGSYSYNYGNYQNTNTGPMPTCKWCSGTFDTDNPAVALTSIKVATGTQICYRCWEMAEEHATNTLGQQQSKDAELGNLKNLLTFAARYVQVCLEGGDWDIIDKTIDVSADTLARIRRTLGLKDTHDFTKR